MRIDYCNYLLYGSPAANYDVLRRVQNILARLITQSVRRSSAELLLETQN